jgi:hypothetical protein
MLRTPKFHRHNPSRRGLWVREKTTLTLVGWALLLSFPSNVVARLWDSEVEITKRYGPCVRKIDNDPVFGNLSVYYYNKYEIRISFIDGKSQSEYYTHRDPKTVLTSDEIEFLLQLNSHGRTWNKSPELPLWRLDNSQAVAIYRSEGGGALGVCTAEFLGWQHHQETRPPK